jgi:putative FmdB family regulatory protein
VPTYSFKCRKCKRRFEEVLTFKEYDQGKRKCPKCKSGDVEQLLDLCFAKTTRKS